MAARHPSVFEIALQNQYAPRKPDGNDANDGVDGERRDCLARPFTRVAQGGDEGVACGLIAHNMK
jgi:hypothetical protein